ncbi:tRNA pseudouridine(55) synthase TruB [Vibrio metschnikovii]
MLRRIGVANYPYQSMVTLEQLNALVEEVQGEESEKYQRLDELLLPMDTAVQDLPEVNLIAELAHMVQHGQAVQVFGAPTEGLVRMTEGEQRRFLGVGQIDQDGKVAPKRLVVYPQ